MGVISKLIDVILNLDKYLGLIIQNYGVLTYLILFLVVFFETALVLTPFLPGDSLLFITGAFAAAGALNLWLLVFLLIIAAVLGDTVNYWIGSFFGEMVFMKSRLFKQEYLDRTKEFYDRHGGKTVVLARFIPIIRTFAPFVAGISRMNYFNFLFCNVIGGVLWVMCFMLAGYYFGGIGLVKENLTLIVFGVIFVSFIPMIAVVLKKNKDKLKTAVNKEYFYLLLLCIVSLAVFIIIAVGVVNDSWIAALDNLVYGMVKELWNPAVTPLMSAFTHIADTLPILVMAILLFLFLMLKRRKYSAVLFAASMIMGLLLKEGLKYALMRERPEGGLIPAVGYSFPSGHATMSMIFFFLIIYLFKNEFRHVFLKGLFVLAFSLLVIMIAMSRIYLGVHWLSDVIAGIALGLFCVSFFMVVTRFVRGAFTGKKRAE